MTVTVAKGKVVIRLGKCQRTVSAERAAKMGLLLLDAAKKAANRQFNIKCRNFS